MSAAKLDEYRAQLAQVDAAIASDPGNQEWAKLRADLLEVIELTSELAAVKETAGPSTAVRPEDLRTYSVGEKCQAIFEQDGQWYNAKVVALVDDGYFVTYLGYGNTGQARLAARARLAGTAPARPRLANKRVIPSPPARGRWSRSTITPVQMRRCRRGLHTRTRALAPAAHADARPGTDLRSSSTR